MAPSKGKKKETEEVEAELGPQVREGAERSGIQDDNHTLKSLNVLRIRAK